MMNDNHYFHRLNNYYIPLKDRESSKQLEIKNSVVQEKVSLINQNYEYLYWITNKI